MRHIPEKKPGDCHSVDRLESERKTTAFSQHNDFFSCRVVLGVKLAGATRWDSVKSGSGF